MGATLYTVVMGTKLQVEFDPVMNVRENFGSDESCKHRFKRKGMV